MESTRLKSQLLSVTPKQYTHKNSLNSYYHYKNDHKAIDYDVMKHYYLTGCEND